MKKFISLFLIFTMIFSALLLFGCNKKNASDEPKNSEETDKGNLLINGNYADDYSIVCSEEFDDVAVNLAYFLSVLNGKVMPIVRENEQTSTYAVKFIKYDIDDEKVLDYNYKSSEGNILFYVALKDAESAVNQFIETYTPKEKAEKYSIRVDEPYVEFLGTSDYSSFTFNKIETFEKITDGVNYYCYKYTDSDGFPVRAHIVIADPGSVRIEVGIPNAVEDKVDGHEQTVANQVKAAENKYGYDIVSACNGSFFYMNKDPNSSPTGICVKNGIVVSSLNDGYNDTFAIMKDGSYYIGDARNVDLNNAWQMLSGHFIPIKDGHIVYQIDDGTHIFNQMGDRYPRTAIGIREDGTLVMIVIDGRQLKVSMGATLYDLGEILLSLGCVDAINLDGGGSSTLYTNVVKNSPSDGKERKVGNCVFFVKNEDYNKE